MWIATNKGFISAIQPKRKQLPVECGHLSDPIAVRARHEDALHALFPNAKVWRGIGTDYPCRVFVERLELQEVMARELADLTYNNFKDSVRDEELHDAYMAVWGVMHRYQRGGFARKARSAPLFAASDLVDPDDWDDEDDWTDRYGDFDTGEDEADSTSHLRIPPAA